jgi:phosphatidate cytidylyltransferase
MLRWRLILGVLIVAALVGLCWLDAHAAIPGIWLMPLVIIVTVLATKEVLDLLAAAGLQPVRWVVHLINLLVVISPWTWCWHLYPSLAATSNIVASVIVPIFALFLAEMYRYREQGGSMANLAAGFLAWVYIGLMLKTAVELRMSSGIGIIAAWIIVVKMGDTGAYLVGRLIGRHKMAPLISPGKTIEGAVGALVFSCIGSWLAFQWLVPFTTPEVVSQGSWWGWIVFGLLVGGAGIFGDLAESLLKRDVGVKDSSMWLPGFGGVLDIIDSLLLSSPVVWFCWASGMVGR